MFPEPGGVSEPRTLQEHFDILGKNDSTLSFRGLDEREPKLEPGGN